MDSMVNHYTANRRLRQDDAYTAGGRHGMRPDYPAIVYTKIIKSIYPDMPVIVGGIEYSLRCVWHIMIIGRINFFLQFFRIVGQI